MVALAHAFQVYGNDGETPTTLDSLTVVVKNRANLAQATYGPATGLGSSLPAWLTYDGSGTYTFSVTLADTLSMPADFAILELDGIRLGGARVRMTRVAPFSVASLPTVPADRAPYADMAFAAEFFSLTLDGSLWNSTHIYRGTQALITASDDLDMEVYKGRRAGISNNSSESRQFPRVFPEFGSRRFADYLVADSEGIPIRVKRACCVQALFLLQTLGTGQDPNSRRNVQYAGLTGFTQGRQSESWDHTRVTPNRICAPALDLIRPYLKQSVDIGYYR